MGSQTRPFFRQR